MAFVVQKVLVVGGNGFVGSASGRPYKTPKGHSPAWTSKVDWQKGNALEPESYAHLLPGVTAVVHTTGTLFSDIRYKNALAKGDVLGLIKSFVQNTSSTESANPLEKDSAKPGSFEQLNRDAALRVCEAFVASKPDHTVNGPRPFVYLSAEDMGRPFVSARYIETKREAETGIQQMVRERPDYRAVFIRPSLVYHPHFRPLTSPAAAILNLSATIHAKTPSGVPTPSGVLRALGSAFPPAASAQSPSAFKSLANTLEVPPIHVDHVAEAISIAVDQAKPDVQGVYGVAEMRELIGWSQKGQASRGTSVPNDVA